MLIINKIAEVPKVKNEVGGSSSTYTLPLGVASVTRDAAIQGIWRDAVDLSVRLLVHIGSPRAFSARDDKMGDRTLSR